MAENSKNTVGILCYRWPVVCARMETLEQYESATPHQIIRQIRNVIVDAEKFHLQIRRGLKPLAISDTED